MRSTALVIVELYGTGHRFEYVAQTAQAAVARGHTVSLVTTREAIATPEFKTNITPLLPGGLTVVITARPRTSSPLVGLLIQNCKEPIVVPEVDRLPLLVLAISIIKSLIRSETPIVGLLMRPPAVSTTGWRAAAKLGLWSLISRLPKVRIAVLADCFGDFIGQPKAARWYTVSDKPAKYSDSGPEVNRAVRPRIADDGSKRILIGGMISDRKAVIEVAQSVLRQTNHSVSVVGSVKKDVADVLFALQREYPDRLRITNSYVTNEELDEAIRACDVVSVVLKSASGSSGMLARACIYGKPVLAGGPNVTVRQAVELRGMGIVAANLSEGALAGAVETLTAHLQDYVELSRISGSEILRQADLGQTLVEIACGGQGDEGRWLKE